MTQIEAMKQALEALQFGLHVGFDESSERQIQKGGKAFDQHNQAITALRQAIEQAEHYPPECQTEAEKTAYAFGWWNALESVRAEKQEPDFITHAVENAYDWSEWVCPDPKSYLMKCCDCGLVHEAEFKVVRYESETEREYCEDINDPNVQAVFRMRRSEQWTPEDMAHRAGGLPIEQAEKQAQKQKPERWAAYMDGDERVTTYDSEIEACGERECEIDNDYEPGIEVEYLVAPMIDAKESLRRCNALRIGERIHEDIDCSLGDDMGAEDEVLSLDKDDLTDLGNLVIEFLCVRAKTKWWTVDHKREQKRTYIAGSDDEAAHGIKG